jgi:hypothetical protein
MRCAHCGADFTPKNSRGRFCSTRCRCAAWQAERLHQEDRVKGLVKVLAKAVGLRAEDLL